MRHPALLQSIFKRFVVSNLLVSHDPTDTYCSVDFFVQIFKIAIHKCFTCLAASLLWFVDIYSIRLEGS